MFDDKSTCNISAKSLICHFPDDHPWKLLDALIQDVPSETVPEGLLSLIRSRDQNKLQKTIKDIGSLQCITCSSGTTVADKATSYQLWQFLKRFQFDSDKESRRETAKAKFLEAEEHCKWFNTTGSKLLYPLGCSAVSRAIIAARQDIANLLGDDPQMDELLDSARFGPGSTTQLPFSRRSAYFKYASWPYDVTERARPFAELLILNDQRWLTSLQTDYLISRNLAYYDPQGAVVFREGHVREILDVSGLLKEVLRTVPGNRICFVPKDGLTDRPIAIEPTMNLMLQLGVDGYIRNRLRCWGVDLNDQRPNQRLAKTGSITGDYATIDLSSASDTVSLRIVKMLLPARWYSYLLALRSPTGELDGQEIRYRKVSSMGNGYTFALESLIFSALIRATMKVMTGSSGMYQFVVYGDDLVVHKNVCAEVLHNIKWFGFIPNLAKSFVQGPARESCGTDWYMGENIRPVYLSEPLRDITSVFSLYNRLRKWYSTFYPEIDYECSHVATMLLTWIPVHAFDLTGPVSECVDAYLHRGWPHYRPGYPYHVRLLTHKTKGLSANNFHIRKLMHDLRSHTVTGPWYLDKSGGSRFAVREDRKDLVYVTATVFGPYE